MISVAEERKHHHRFCSWRWSLVLGSREGRGGVGMVRTCRELWSVSTGAFGCFNRRCHWPGGSHWRSAQPESPPRCGHHMQALAKSHCLTWKWKCLATRLHCHVWLFVTPWTVALQVPLAMGFSRQEYWSGLPCPPSGELPNPGMECRSPALHADSWPSEPPTASNGFFSIFYWIFDVAEEQHASGKASHASVCSL